MRENHISAGDLLGGREDGAGRKRERVSQADEGAVWVLWARAV